MVNLGGSKNHKMTETRRHSVKELAHFLDWCYQLAEEPLLKWIVRETSLGTVSLVLNA